MIRRGSSLVPLALALCFAGCPPPSGGGTQGGAAPTSGPTGAGAGGDAPAPAPAPAPFDKATARTPWKRCQVGDWATYTMFLPGGKKRVMKFVVTEVTDDAVGFEVRDGESGELRSNERVELAEEEARYKAPNEYDALDGEPATKTIDFDGRQLEVVVLKRKKGDSTTELWLAEQDVRPFNQSAIKSFRNGELMLQLDGFGSAE